MRAASDDIVGVSASVSATAGPTNCRGDRGGGSMPPSREYMSRPSDQMSAVACGSADDRASGAV